MWLIAGPNGSGKSTIAKDGFLEKFTGAAVTILNPDVRTREPMPQDQRLSLQAANFQSCLRNRSRPHDRIGTSFAVETVLCVAQGGHDVPPEKVVTRWDRSLANLPWFALRADRAMIFDNTGARQSRATRVARFETLELNGTLRLLATGYHPRVDAELAPILRDDETVRGGSAT